MRKNKKIEHGFDSIKTKRDLEQFQRKWEPVSRPELRQNKEIERFRRFNLRWNCSSFYIFSHFLRPTGIHLAGKCSAT